MTGVTGSSAPSAALSDLSPTRHRERLRRTIRTLHAVVLALFAVAVLGNVARGDGSSYVGAHLALAAGLALGAALVLVRGERTDHLVLLVPLALSTVLPVFRGAGDVSAGLALNAALLTVVRTLPPARSLAAIGAVVLAHAGLCGVLDGGLTVTEVADPYLLSAANIAVAGIVVASLERSTGELDAAAAEGAARMLALLQRDSADAAVDGARRVLHDDVLTALRAVADDATPPARAREASAAAVASVERLEGPSREAPTSVAAVVAGLVEPAVPLPDSLGALVLTPAAGAAVRRAVGEALRNVERHAAGASARLLVTGGTGGVGTVTFVVEDDGPGAAPGDAEGFGLVESVRRPVEAVGGHVEIGPAVPGASAGASAGLRVAVTVPVSGAELPPVGRPTGDPGTSGTRWRWGSASVDEAFRSVLGAGAARRLAVVGMLPLVAYWTFVAVVEIPSSATPVRQALVLGALLGTTLVVARRLASDVPNGRWVLGIGVVLVVLQVLGLLLVPPGGMLDLRGWSVGFVAVLPIILCFVLPVRWGLGLVASQVAVVLGAAAVDPALAGGGVPVNSLNAVTTPALLTTLLGVRLRRNAAAAEVAREESWRAVAELVRREALGEASSRHLDHTRRVVVPWLRAVAAQPTASSDAQREQAGLLALEARDDLHVPGFHTPGLRRAVTDFRRAGGRVDLRPGLDGERHADAADRLLRLLPRLGDGSRVTLTPHGADGAGVRTVVTPPPPAEVVASLTGEPGTEVTCDDFVLVVTSDAGQGRQQDSQQERGEGPWDR